MWDTVAQPSVSPEKSILVCFSSSQAMIDVIVIFPKAHSTQTLCVQDTWDTQTGKLLSNCSYKHLYGILAKCLHMRYVVYAILWLYFWVFVPCTQDTRFETKQSWCVWSLDVRLSSKGSNKTIALTI